MRAAESYKQKAMRADQKKPAADFKKEKGKNTMNALKSIGTKIAAATIATGATVIAQVVVA